MAGVIYKILRHIKSGDLYSLLYHKTLCYIKSKYYTNKYCKYGGKIIVKSSNIKLNIDIRGGGKLHIFNSLILSNFINQGGDINIIINNGATLTIKNDFILGANIKIVLDENANLEIGGKLNESGSGITENCVIMCKKHIHIGYDLICAWNTYIYDCEWHKLSIAGNPQEFVKEVYIGDHVWIGSNVIIGKGSYLHDNAVIGAFTKIQNKEIAGNGVTAGLKPHLLRENVSWKRDL